MPIPTIRLSSGYDMPMLRLGTWQSAPGQVGIDTYFHKLLQIFSHEIPSFFREKTISSGQKSGTHFTQLLQLKKILRSQKNVDEILKELQLNYVDLMLINWPHAHQEGDGLLPKKAGSDKVVYSSEAILPLGKHLKNASKRGRIREVCHKIVQHSKVPEYIRENADLFDFQLTAEEMKAIDEMDRGWRILHLGDDTDHPLYPRGVLNILCIFSFVRHLIPVPL
ncbi:hypothetical protein ANCCAN_04324 [Ancylostoma caninum]|uniref:NADP-dependent oxidoreductase domain-containing protein n=1 Tax=Ancylostoma caninum TaxID=29170 RepID=A0A368GYX2_ANCCA|nr:hypothetical protein ANCCAN_04324 [Ancylostoma caninum]